MRSEKRVLKYIIAVLSILVLSLSLFVSGCGHPFPYQGSINGNWSGQLTVIGRNIPIGGTMSINTDAKGIVSGTLTSTSGGANPATMNAQVDANGNLTGTVSFTLNSTTFVSNWQGKITASGNSLGLQGTWTSQHGSGTFSGTGNSSK
jgi:hypothetical protein